MRNLRKRLTALLLAGCLILGLAACGHGRQDTSQAAPLGGAAYRAEFEDCDLPVDSVLTAAGAGRFLYIAGQTSKTENNSSIDYPELYRINVETGVVEQVSNYAPLQSPDGEENYTSISSVCPGSDDTLWIAEQVTKYQFDLPDGFDAETDSVWNYDSDVTTVTYWRHLDSSGKELAGISETELLEKLGATDIYGSAAALSDGGLALLLYSDGLIAVLDSDLNVKWKVSAENLSGDIAVLGDGDLGVGVYDDETSNYLIRKLRISDGNWGDEYANANSGTCYPGNGKYLFFMNSGDILYGYHADTREREAIIQWSAADIDYDQVSVFSVMEDGRAAVLLQNTDTTPVSYEFALLTPMEDGQQTEKTVLTLAAVYLDSDIRTQVINFNKHSDKYRIVINDYSQFNTSDDASAGLTRLNTEIVAGRVPDILATSSSLPLRQYAAKGYLEDLWPMIENDTDLGREGVMENVLKAAEVDGKLYQVFDSFYIQTVAGSPRIVGDQMGWTLAELQAALAKMPEGCQIFGQYDTKTSILSNILNQNLDRYVDWSSGTASFDSQDFISALEFCNSFPDETAISNNDEYEAEPDRITSGRQMLLTDTLTGFTDIQMHKAIFGGEVTYIGYPTESGTGSSFYINSGLAISSTCADKEGAWSFVRQILLPDENKYIYGFPVNRTSFEKMAEESMTATYVTDENGQQVLDEDGNPIEESKGGYGWGNTEIELKATTQSEYDQIMALYQSIDTIGGYDEVITEIVQEDAAAYFAGDRTAEDTAKMIQSRVSLYVGEQS